MEASLAREKRNVHSASEVDGTEEAAMSGDGGPPDFEALRAAVAGRTGSLPKRLAQVGRYALERPDEIAFGTTASIAGAAGVQPSTLVRFAHQFGYGGFSDLQRIFRERLRERPSAYGERMAALRAAGRGGNDQLPLLDGFLGAAAQSIDKLAHGFDGTRFARAVEVLAGAGTIFLVARRRAFPLTAYMVYGFGKLGIRVELVNSPAGTDPETIAYAKPSDAALAVSFTPYAAETVDHARALAEAGVPLVAITDSVFSPLAEVAAVWLEVVEADYAGFRSLSASMALSMALTVAVAKARDES